MNESGERFVLDANAFIQAKRRFYGMDFCPGYWETLIWHHEQGRLCSIDRVRNELLRGADDLTNWVEEEFGKSAFQATSTAAVAGVYAQMLEWVTAQTQFLDSAKAEFQQVADGWLAAFGKANNYVVVTLEEYDPVVRKKVPLPNVCRAFGLDPVTPFEMLRRLNVELNWQPTP